MRHCLAGIALIVTATTVLGAAQVHGYKNAANVVSIQIEQYLVAAPMQVAVYHVVTSSPSSPHTMGPLAGLTMRVYGSWSWNHCK